MSTETTKDTLPFTCTPAYDRDACKGCVCSTCFVTGAAPVWSRDIGRSGVTLMRGLIITEHLRDYEKISVNRILL